MVLYSPTCTTPDSWIVWNQTVGTTAATSTLDIWPLWVSNATVATTSITSAANAAAATFVRTMGVLQQQMWTVWNQQLANGGGHTLSAIAPRRSGRVQMAADEMARHAQYEREAQARYEAERALRVAAEAKAELLLQRLLTAEQSESLKEKRHFYLYSRGSKYRIDRGSRGNVKLVDERDQVIESYCIHPTGVPDADAMAAQKLMLEADPETFLRVANVTRRDGTYRAGTPLAAVG
jgi:hypothetical protein